MTQHLNLIQAARICYEANRALCMSLGDGSQRAWEDAAEWQHNGMLDGVEWRLLNMNEPASAQHEQWMLRRLRDGWQHGEVKSEKLKTHPCLVPYEQLPPAQRAKDALFVGIVKALAPYLSPTPIADKVEKRGKKR